MVAVLLVPVVLLLVPCLLALLERRVAAEPVAARTPVARHDIAAEPAAPEAAVAPVVPLRAGPVIDGDTPPLRPAS